MAASGEKYLGDVLVLGMGGTGAAVCRYLASQGPGRVSSVTLYGGASSREGDLSCELEAEGVRCVLGTEDVAGSYDLAVASPGISEFSAFFSAARACAREVIGEPEFAFRESPERWVAITGTNGKTTTTTLLGKIFENAGRITHVAGNIGYPLSNVAISAKREDVTVVEVSSFQLESVKTFHPHVAALLNITEDHLNRHGTMAQYIRMKQRLFENQTADDFAVLNYDDPVLNKMAEKLKSQVAFFSRTHQLENGAFVKNGKIVWQWKGETRPICDADSILIPGPHNLENALAAAAMACAMNVPAPVIRHTLQTFTGVEHRIEKVRVLDGVTYINDSKGTNVDSTIKAVQSMRAPTVLVLGGSDKHVSFDALAREIIASGQIKCVVLCGATAPQIESALLAAGYTAIEHAEKYPEMVALCRRLAVPGGNVLLSPACASFDQFSDYEQRGRIFKQLVNELQ